MTFVAPLELLRTKLQSERLSYRQLHAVVQSARASTGWRTLWLGWAPMMMRDVPFSAIYWSFYESLKASLLPSTPTQLSTFAVSFTAGALSGSIASFVTLPLDVIKTRRQIQIGQAMAAGTEQIAETKTWRLIVDLQRTSGTRALFAGWCYSIELSASSRCRSTPGSRRAGLCDHDWHVRIRKDVLRAKKRISKEPVIVICRLVICNYGLTVAH